MAGQQVLIKFQNKSGAVIIRRKRKENGCGYIYHRCHANNCLRKNQSERKNPMTNAKNQAVLFTLNLIEAGMTADEIREKLFLEELEVRPEVIEYYREVVKAKKNGEPVPAKPDFKELKRLAIEADKQKKSA